MCVVCWYGVYVYVFVHACGEVNVGIGSCPSSFSALYFEIGKPGSIWLHSSRVRVRDMVAWVLNLQSQYRFNITLSWLCWGILPTKAFPQVQHFVFVFNYSGDSVYVQVSTGAHGGQRCQNLRAAVPGSCKKWVLGAELMSLQVWSACSPAPPSHY